MTNLIPSPSVSLVNDRPATTSFAIAEHFGKRHDDVLKSIRKLMADIPDDVRARNFAETFRTVAGPNNSQRQEIYFTVFFDGFILLAMGYTGKQALQIKLVYIAAFNAMRNELAIHPQPSLPAAPSTVADRRPLNDLVDVWVSLAPITKRQAWEMIHAHFNVKSITHLDKDELSIVMDFVQARIDSLPKELPSQPAALPPARPTPEDRLEEIFACLQGLRSAMADKEREAFDIMMQSARLGLRHAESPARSIIIHAHASAEHQFYAMDRQLDAVMEGMKSALAASRV